MGTFGARTAAKNVFTKNGGRRASIGIGYVCCWNFLFRFVGSATQVCIVWKLLCAIFIWYHQVPGTVF